MPRVLAILLLSAVAAAQSGGQQTGQQPAQQPAQTQTKPPAPGPNAPPPRSDDGTRAPSAAEPGTSSSRDTLIDLSPPPGDKPTAASAPDDVSELHPFDPHKAAKDVEVGEYYFSQKNYMAALSRFEEALYWKPNDAIATFRLAEISEKLGKNDDAVKYYTDYLRILPRGPQAEDARKSLARLGAPVPPAPPPGPQDNAAADNGKAPDPNKKSIGKRIKDQFGSDWCVSAAGAQGCTKKPPVHN